MPEPIRSGLELVSFHTVSKGAWGECGMRGGYMELHNFDPAVVDELYKISAINLCSNMPGQIALGIMVNPPKPGDPSYPLFIKEKEGLIDSLKRRARLITDAFNGLEGVDCQETDGGSYAPLSPFTILFLLTPLTLPSLPSSLSPRQTAMYSFPKITLPQSFIEAAQAQGKAPDVLYCLELLKETGLSCVPGSGFQQKAGTFHIRTTILPQESDFPDIVQRFTSFHKNFLRKYGAAGRSKL